MARSSTGTSLTKEYVQSIIGAHGLPRRIWPHVYRRVRDELRAHNKPLSDVVMPEAVAIRAKSLYPREVGTRQWKFAYKEISRAKSTGSAADEALIPALRKGEHQELLAKVRSDCHGSFREAWQAMPRESQAEVWQRLAFWLLRNDPRLLLDFLLVTTEGTVKPDSIMVAGCLRYIDKFHYEEAKDWQSGSHTYQSAIETCFHPKDWPVIVLSQKAVHLYIKRASPDALGPAFEIATERQVQLAPETILSFMYRFIEQGNVNSALKALARIAELNNPDFTLNSEGVKRHCCKLLTLDTVQDDPDGRNFHILPQLLEIGVQPDQSMMNIVLSNALRAGDDQLGASMLQFMKQHGHEYDSYTYLALLNDAVARGDRGRVDVLINEVESQQELRQNPYIASKVLHSYYVFTTKHMDIDVDPASVFYLMLDLYSRVHDITPLKELLIIPQNYSPQGESLNVAPLPSTIYIMLATFFRCQRRHSSFSTVQRIYTQFHHLVMQGSPIVAPLVETDHTYNEFLVALRSNPRGMRLCVRIVEDMLHPPPTQMNSHTGKAIVHSKPTIRTWTLLLSAFIFNRQHRAAARVREMMTQYNVEYDHVAWNIIINGFANSQNVPETALAIKQMEQAGHAIDPYTMKSLRYLRDPERLWVAIDELDERHSETLVHNDEQKRDGLVDRGLEKLDSQLKSKL